MKGIGYIFVKLISRKVAVTIVVATSFVSAFATLGDGGFKSNSLSSFHPLLSVSRNLGGNMRSFSLKTNYNFRGNEVINSSIPKYINVNTKIVYQRGKTSYILPIKKKVLLNNIKISLGNR